jgi:class 3 adenylate cyclase/predicted ATPase
MPCREHLQAVLRAVLTYLPREVAQTRLADPAAAAILGTFTQATLMFADISGFTAMSERLTQLGREGAEIITGIVNDYFAAMLEVIARHDGDLFKFGGDALLVSFSGAGATRRGCGAALEMQAEMARFAVLETEQGEFSLRMKVGLGTGTLFLASLGAPERLEFAVMGPALGYMARAEDLAEATEVLIDRATRDALGPAAVIKERAPGFYHLVKYELQDSMPTAVPPFAVEVDDISELVQRLNVLTPYLPPRVVERITASPRQMMIEGEHRLVTVLFANFYGIDAIIDALGPDREDELTQLLNRHFTTMQGIIDKYGGIINKVDTYVVGYRIMALFGAPVAHEDDPARAVQAALEMQAAMAAFTDLSTSAGRFTLQQRIGVNTGYVFAGNLGSALRQEYSVMGDEVNLAARLMGIATAGELLISHATARHIEGLFVWQEREPVRVKGKSEPVRNYRVSQRVVDHDERAAERGVFFGRREELKMARALVDAARAGHGVVLDVSGERGVGKSRLVEELSRYARRRGLAVLWGEALSYGRGVPYLPWLAVLRALLGFQEGERPAARRDKLVTALAEMDLEQWMPIVGDVLGLDVPETPLTASLSAQLRQQRFFDVVLQLIQGQAAHVPTLLVLDDVQWADAVSLDLAAYVARNVPDSPLLFVLIHWPDMARLPWREGDGVRRGAEVVCRVLELAELSQRASLDLARSILRRGQLSAPLRRLILERAQGNPLFVEEVTRVLRESDAIRLETSKGDRLVWEIAGGAASVQVPTTLAGLIMGRLDRLETGERRLLQVAAVIGVMFRASVLARVYPYDDLEGQLSERLAVLGRMDLTASELPDEYKFRQTLTQEVAYESLSFARRRALHVRVGEDIERHHSGDLAESYEVLARHFDEGRLFDKALIYLVKAGDKARDEFANQAALDDYQRALQVAAELEDVDSVASQVLDVLEAMGDVYLLVSRYPEAVERFQQAIAHRLCDARRCGDLLRKVAKAYELQGQYEEALGYLAQGHWVLSGSEQDQRSVEMARIYGLSGWIHMRRGEIKVAVEDCEQGLAILAGQARDDSVLRDEADLHHTLGTVYVEQGRYARAAEAYQRSTDLRHHAGDLMGLARSFNNLALTAWSQGDLNGARDYLQRSLEINQQIGDNYGLAFGYNNLGAVSYTTGDAEGALNYYHVAFSLRQRIGDNYGLAQTASNIAEAYLSLKQYDETRRYLQQAAALFEKMQSEAELPEVYSLLAEVALARGNIDLALVHAERARDIAETVGNPVLQGLAERGLARAQAQHGDDVQARHSFQASIEMLQSAGHQVELARSHYEFGVLLAGQTAQKASARQHLSQAAELFADAGAERESAQARDALQALR